MSLIPPTKVGKLQETLHAKAKSAPTYRFYALYDKVYRADVLWHAYQCCRLNDGTAGVDGQTFADIEAYGVGQWLGELAEELRKKTYRPQAVRRVYIPKPDGKQRPLGIPTIKDRVVQMAVLAVLGPIFEADLQPEQYAYRPGRSALEAVQQVQALMIQGHTEVVDADLSGYFDSIPHSELMKSVARRVSDRQLLALIKAWLETPVEESDARGHKQRTTRNKDEGKGTPQGAPLSPLLSNIYLNPLDHQMAAQGYQMIRYADDFVILCRSQAEAEQALALIRQWCADEGLQLHPTKTKIVDVRNAGFDFLGYHFQITRRGRLACWPRKKSMQKLKDTIRAKTTRTNGHSLAYIIADVNRTLRGWFGYFKHSCQTTFTAVDGWVRMRLRSILHSARANAVADVDEIINVGRTRSLPSMGISPWKLPMPRRVNPLRARASKVLRNPSPGKNLGG